MDFLESLFKAADALAKVIIKIYDECPDPEVKKFIASCIVSDLKENNLLIDKEGKEI